MPRKDFALMVNAVNKIPSINLPLTNEQGIIHPIWYEYLRSFIAGVDTAGSGTGASNTVIAGAGIEGTGAVSTVNVGEGEGITVDANSIGVDIIHQTNAQAAVEDEILIADASDASRIRKTSLRDVAALSVANPGGNTTQIQYNNNGVFAGDTGFTTDGAGSVDITGDLDVDSININGNTLSTPNNATPMVFNVPAGGLNQFMFAQSGAGNSAFTTEFRGLGASSTILIRSDANDGSSTSNSLLSFATNTSSAEWTMGLYDNQDDDFVLAHGTDLNVTPIFTIDRGDNTLTHNVPVIIAADQYIRRSTTAGITASTTQTQGQGALTAEVNEISVCANANDTVTLPSALAGRSCLVINNGAQTLQVFPASGDNLGAGVDTSTTIATTSRKLFVSFDSTNWEPVI